MALTGGILSVLVMWLFKQVKFFGVPGVSLFGSLAHVFGQFAMGLIVIGEGLIIWLPLMLVLGIVTGFIIGLIARQFIKITEGWFSKDIVSSQKKKENNKDDFID